VSLIESLDVEFPSGTPRWLSAFAEDPSGSLSALLAGRWYHGALNAEDPDNLLLDWGSGLRDIPEFVDDLDDAFATWIDDHWTHPDLDPRPEVAWHRALRVIALLDADLPRAAHALRARRPDALDVLGPMTRGPSKDPMGWYWVCLALNQPTDELLSTWWKLCRLQPGVPYFHGRIGLLGLRRVPGEDLGRFRSSVADGLTRLASGLDERVEARLLRQRVAEKAAKAAAIEVFRAYPFPRAWTAYWSQAAGNLAPRPRAWLTAVLGEPTGGATRRQREVVVSRSDPEWPQRRHSIADRLRKRSSGALEAADELIAEQRNHAARSGDYGDLVRTLCMLSAGIRDRAPTTASAWAEEAMQWDPWDPFNWTSAVAARLAMHDLDTALLWATEAVERFPDDVVARNRLAEVLRAAGRLDEAEAVYRETRQRFPDNVFAPTGLAQVLRAAGRLDEAEAVYRETRQRFPNDVFAPTGLAEVLRAAGRLDEAEAVYRETRQRFPNDVVARNGLAEVLRAAGRLDEAEATYRETRQRFPDNSVARTGLAEVLRAAGRLDEAEAVYRETRQRFPDNAIARTGLAEVLRAAGRLDEAEAVYRETSERFPNDVFARTGLAEVLRAAGRLDEAEAIYRETTERFPDNVVARTGLAAVRRDAGRPTAAATGEPEARKGTPDKVAVTAPKRRGPGQEATGADAIGRAPRAIRAEAATRGVVSPATVHGDTLETRVKWARALLRVASLTPPARRATSLQDAEALIDEVLASQPRHAAALFSKLEVLIDQNRVDEAFRMLGDLPEYLIERSEFLAIRGRLAWLRTRSSGPVPYSDDVMRFMLDPWDAAGRRDRILAANVPLARLRAASIVYDGLAVEKERANSAETLRSLLATSNGVTARRPSRYAALRTWWRHELVAGFSEVNQAEATFDEFEAVLNERPQLFDALERDLVDASRYSASAG